MAWLTSACFLAARRRCLAIRFHMRVEGAPSGRLFADIAASELVNCIPTQLCTAVHRPEFDSNVAIACWRNGYVKLRSLRGRAFVVFSFLCCDGFEDCQLDLCRQFFEMGEETPGNIHRYDHSARPKALRQVNRGEIRSAPNVENPVAGPESGALPTRSSLREPELMP